MSSSNSSLIFEERAFTCGYGPRSILGSSADSRNDLYIGCKDGSVTVVRGPANGSKLEGFAPPEVCSTLNSGVRALCEVTSSRLLAGLADGSVIDLWVADSSKGKREVVPGSDRPANGQTNPVRAIARLKKDRFLVSRRRGAFEVRREGVGWTVPQAINGYPEDVRVIQPLKKPGTNDVAWLLVTGRGAVHPWDGIGEIPKSTAWGPCQDDEHPAILNDFAPQRNATERNAGGAARGLFLATDLGVFLLTVLDDEPFLHCQPISLPGLGAMPSALSYSEVMVGTKRLPFLWVADARGDSHLFEQSNPDETGGPLFRRSGVRHTQRETLLCHLWAPSGSPSLLCGQARRNDQLVLGRYWDPDWEREESADLSYKVKVRRLLSHGWWTRPPAADLEIDQDQLRKDLLECLKTRNPGGEGRRFERYEDWKPLEALLTELFESLGEQEDTRSLLIDSIRSPQARIARNLLNGGEPYASRLWTLALLGVIHRSRRDRSLAYLGLLRWLRNRQEELLQTGNQEALARTLSLDLGIARKWGLHGDANARRQNLVDPIRTLQDQEGDRSESDLALDHLTYQALLLNRRISRIDQRTYDRMRGRRAWSLCVVGKPGESDGKLLAVSWMWGGVELFELLEHPAGDPPSRFKPLLRFPSPQPGSENIPPPQRASPDNREGWEQGGFGRDKHGYSRVVYIGRLPGREDRFLLTAPSAPEDEAQVGGRNSPPERILLRRIGAEKQVESYEEVPLDPGQSVYSVLELRPGQLLLGLRGYKGDALIALLSVTIDDEELRGEIKVRRSPTIGNGKPVTNGIRREDSLHRNRVWSLACDPEAISDGSTIDVVIGCEGGQIYRLSLGPKVFASDEVTWKLVDRMSSPVRALLYRAPGHGFPCHRVYAGAENGTVMAWQAPHGDEPTFATLWATQEDGPVAGLHRLTFNDDRDCGSKKPKRTEKLKRKSDLQKAVILAITRLGRAVLLDDRLTPDAAAAPTDRPQRLPVPGSRFGRYRLPEDVWASSLVLGHSDRFAVENGAFCDLLTAAGDGTLALSSLHAPSKSGIRKGRYEYVLEKFRELVDFKGTPANIRLGEAVFATVPSLSWILIRWLLDPAFPDEKYPDPRAVEEWYLPRHLRPLRALRLAWDELEAKELAEPDVTTAVTTVGTALAAALERAWHLEDLHTYQEICAMVLKRANFTLYRTCEQRESQNWLAKKQRIADLYIAVYQAIETSLPSWLGAEKRQEARARAVVAKQMVDGDTIWKVMKEVAEEKARGKKKPFARILETRVSGVRELVHKRDPMVSLEALRAANLSLMRLCLRLVQRRAEMVRANARGGDEPVAVAEAARYTPLLVKGSPETHHVQTFWDFEVEWSAFEDYFNRLTAAAARTFHARLELTDALAHEYSRTFALFVCICPSATIRIANRLTEKLLIRDLESEDDLSKKVLRQLDLLSDIGLPCPDWARKLFKHVTAVPGPKQRHNPMSSEAMVELGLKCPKEADDSSVESELGGRVGELNTQDLVALERLYEVVGWFVDLSFRLSNDARGLDLSPEALNKKLHELKAGENGKSDPYYDSREFWTGRIEDLKTRLPKESTGTQEPQHGSDSIRPEVVLRSRKLHAWAIDSLEVLHDRQRNGKLYVPEVPIFRRIFEDLREAAKTFPTSATVHKNLVGGILGHHLLENLDEHILELEEIAQALDPVSVNEIRNGRPVSGSSASTAQRFAAYLIRRARGAQSIPKNLRALQTMLTARFRPEGQPKGNLSSLLSHWPARFENKGPEIKVEQTKLALLGITLDELAQNHAKHCGLYRHGKDLEAVPLPRIKVAGEPARGLSLVFPFSFQDGDPSNRLSNYYRLDDLKNSGLQATTEPRDQRDVGSTGSGLYLANMAAAMAGWKLWIEEVGQDKSKASLAWCHFVLEEVNSESES